jgi:4-hydroxy-3-methylbut-2-enyl diphosphate reductase
VVSLLGFAGKKGWVVGSLEELRALPRFEQAIVVAQTTQNQAFYQQVKQWVSENNGHYKVFDTICDSTERRQTEVRHLAQEVDAVVVVGGKESGNTRRLAEVVMAAGKPAFHIETESELDLEALRHVQSIGITAGASTPTWIIKRVVRAIEQLPIQRRQGIGSLLLRMQRLALLTNLYVALGAGCLCYAATHLQRLATSRPAIGVAVLYVLSMHILNHLTSRAEDRYNDPDRERFYIQHKSLLTVMALSAGALGLVAAFQMGMLPFWTLLVMSLLGLSYNLRLFPTTIWPTCRFRRIRDLPGSKTILIAVAWGVVTGGLPALAADGEHWAAGLLAVAWATTIAFSRTAFFDILDIQGDRIVGKETIPILLGPERALTLLRTMLGAGFLLLLLAGWRGFFSPLAFLLAAGPLFLYGLIALHERGGMLAGMQLEFTAESLFVLTGLLTWVYHLAAA